MLLAINTATQQFSMALMSEAGELAAESLLLEAKKNFRPLMPALDHLLRFAKSNIKDITALAVTTGPGSFTGLRIGLSVAKGICQCLRIPIKILGGPILIGQMTGQLAQESFVYLIPFMAVISINLGILNLLPVPILDGGVIVFLLIELIIGKPISLKKRDLAQKVGLFLLIFLMVVVFYNDISRLLE